MFTIAKIWKQSKHSAKTSQSLKRKKSCHLDLLEGILLSEINQINKRQVMFDFTSGIIFKKMNKRKIKTSIDTENRLIVSARGEEELEGGGNR